MDHGHGLSQSAWGNVVYAVVSLVVKGCWLVSRPLYLRGRVDVLKLRQELKATGCIVDWRRARGTKQGRGDGGRGGGK